MLRRSSTFCSIALYVTNCTRRCCLMGVKLLVWCGWCSEPTVKCAVIYRICYNLLWFKKCLLIPEAKDTIWRWHNEKNNLFINLNIHSRGPLATKIISLSLSLLSFLKDGSVIYEDTLVQWGGVGFNQFNSVHLIFGHLWVVFGLIYFVFPFIDVQNEIQ